MSPDRAGAARRQDCLVCVFAGTPWDVGRQMATDMLTRRTPRNMRYLADWRRWRQDPSTAGRAKAIASALERLWPPVLMETEAFARALHVDIRAILADWAAPPRPVHERGRSCTVFWVPPRLSATGRALVGRNFDLRVEGDPERTFMYTFSSAGLWHAGMGGRSGRAEGVNAAGLIVGTTEAQLREGVLDPVEGGAAHGERIGGRAATSGALPARLATRILLESCSTVGQAITKLSAMAHWTHFNFLLADAHGDAAVFEVGASRNALRRVTAGEGRDSTSRMPWLVTTNHYVSPDLAHEADYRWMTRQKYERAREQLEAAAVEGGGRVSIEGCRTALAAPGVAQRHITLWSEVFEAGGATIWLAPGRPDRNGFVALPAPAAGVAQVAAGMPRVLGVRP